MAEEQTSSKSFYSFWKYDVEEVVVKDPGIAKYLNFDMTLSPHSAGRNTKRTFEKGKMSVIERLANNLMRTEVNTGKKSKSIRKISDALDIIHKKTKSNPFQVLSDAICNCGPREEITRLKMGGIALQKAVDIGPSRRIDIAMRNICKGVVKASFKSKKNVEDILASEIIKASQANMDSFAYSKKEEMERIAKSAR